MTCQTIMTDPPAVFHRDQKLAEAIHILLNQPLPTLPVVDNDGKLVGMFGFIKLLSLALPRAATMEQGIGDLSFISDSAQDVTARLKENADKPLGKFLEPPPAVLHPETELVEALLMLHKIRHVLPVVDAKSHKFLGVVTSWTALKKVAGGF